MVKVVGRVLLSLVLILIVGALLLVLTGNNHLFRGLALTYFSGKKGPTIDDGLLFPRDTVFSNHVSPWPTSADYNRFEPEDSLRIKLDSLETVAFLVIHQDSLLYENYSGGYGEQSLTNSFSMAKSVVGMLIGKAIGDGYIKSVDQAVTEFIPELGEGPGESLQIRHLLQMSSGIDFGESYQNPFGFIAKAYYGYDIESLVLNFRVSKTPGETFVYQGGDTQLLAIVIERATGKKLAEYFSEGIWTEIGAEQNAWWSVDEEGMARASCCIYSNARDYARLGRLYADSGRWQGKQVIPEDYVRSALQPSGIVDGKGGTVDYYGYQIWLGRHRQDGFFTMRGIQGQYVIVIPEQELILVRLGNRRIEREYRHFPLDVYSIINAGYSLIEQRNR